jgi:hypothetical protein
MMRRIFWNVRGVALLMVATAALAVALAPAVNACSCRNNQECTWASACYSDGACAPDGTHRSCHVYSCGLNCNNCYWGGDLGCP